MLQRMCRDERKTVKRALSFCHVSSEDWTQDFRLSSKHLFLLTYWAISTINISTQSDPACPSPESSLVPLPDLLFHVSSPTPRSTSTSQCWARTHILHISQVPCLHGTSFHLSYFQPPGPTCLQLSSVPTCFFCRRHWSNKRNPHAQILGKIKPVSTLQKLPVL